VPRTYADLELYVDEIVNSDRLQMSDVAANVADIIRRGPVPPAIKPVWSFIRFAAFGTLPQRVREIYGVKWSPAREKWLKLNLAALKRVRPLLPRRLRLIGPARQQR
jgi:uncharacterized protein (DUF2236 family)